MAEPAMEQVGRKPSPEELQRLAQAIDELRPALREPFIMSAVEKLDYAEIADRLGITVMKVERRIAAALCALDRKVCGG